MEKQITAKEVRKDMEYLVKLLHKEWERSGKTKAVVTVQLEDVPEIKKSMAGVIADKQKHLDFWEFNPPRNQVPVLWYVAVKQPV